jgi:hypothetical protein
VRGASPTNAVFCSIQSADAIECGLRHGGAWPDERGALAISTADRHMHAREPVDRFLNKDQARSANSKEQLQ